MKSINLTIRWIIIPIIAFFLLCMYSCVPEESEWPQGKEVFETPPWLGGSSIEMLKGDSLNRYTIFLELMEKANYKIPVEKQLFTLFVPDNESFTKYFQSIGKTGVADLTEDEAVQLFTLHILRNSLSRYHLIYEYLWGEEQGPKGEYAALFFRKSISSQSLPKIEIPKYNSTFKGKEVLVYSDNKLIPIFSTDYFEDYFGAPDGSDYLFMYPESKWGNNLNIHSAMVTNAEVRTANGFIYYLDNVIPPMPNINEYLRDKGDEFTVFYDLMQRFAIYSYTKTRETDKVKMFKKGYNKIMDLAVEGGPFGDGERRLKEMYTAFVPTDETLTKYLNEKILNTYESIDSVPEITLEYLVQTQMARQLCLISKIEKSYFNAYGDRELMSRNNIVSAHMCSNGLVYGSNRVLEPKVFTTVPGRLFFDKNYSTFLYAVNTAGLMSRLSDDEQKVTLFAITNEQMEANNIRYNTDRKFLQYRGTDGLWVRMNADLLTNFVLDHIYSGKISDLSGEGFIEMQSKNFVYYNNNSIQAGYNKFEESTPKVTTAIENERNGFLYLIDDAIKTKYSFGQYIVDDPALEKFEKLLVAANLLDLSSIDPVSEDTIPSLRFIIEQDYWTGFLPDNEAIAKAIDQGLIPEITESLSAGALDTIRTFCYYHFVRENVIFDDGKLSGIFSSNYPSEVTEFGTIYAKLTVNNSKNNLSVIDLSGQTVNVKHINANNLVTSGVIHKISSPLIIPNSNLTTF